jgi:hypothetical protein
VAGVGVRPPPITRAHAAAVAAERHYASTSKDGPIKLSDVQVTISLELSRSNGIIRNDTVVLLENTFRGSVVVPPDSPHAQRRQAGTVGRVRVSLAEITPPQTIVPAALMPRAQAVQARQAPKSRGHPGARRSADVRAIGSVRVTSSRMIPKTGPLALPLQGFLKNTPNGRLRRLVEGAI